MHRPCALLRYLLDATQQASLSLRGLAFVQATPFTKKRLHLRASEDRVAVRVEVAEVRKRLVLLREQRLDDVERLWRAFQFITALVLQDDQPAHASRR